jgi:hypothetical protein
MNPTDEQISMWLDGEASDDFAAAIESALATDPELVRRIEEFTDIDARLRQAVDHRLGPTPSGLADIATGAVATLTAPQHFHRERVFAIGRAAAVFIAALVLGVVGDRLMASSGQVSSVDLASGGLSAGDLSDAVGRAASGTPFAARSGRVTVELSFQAADRRWCRSFRLERSDGAGSGVACLSHGAWRLEGWSRNGRGRAETGFVTASSDSDPAVEAMIDRLGIAASINRVQEAKLIRSGWPTQ